MTCKSIWLVLFVAITLAVSSAVGHPQSVRLSGKGSLYRLRRKSLLQLSDEDNALLYAQEQQSEGQEREGEKRQQATRESKSGQADDEDYIEGMEEDYGDEDELEQELQEEEDELHMQKESGQQGQKDQLGLQDTEELERLEEEEYKKQKEEAERREFYDSEEGTEGAAISGREGSSAQESLAKLNGTSNSTATGSATQLPYDEEVQRAINAHLDGGSVSHASNTSTASSQTSSASNDEAMKAEEEYLQNLQEEEGESHPQDLEHSSTGFEDATQRSGGNTESLSKGSSDTLEENFVKTSNVSVAAAPDSLAQRNASIMAQGAILGSTIGTMVKDNSSSIAGVVGLLIAGGAGVAVAFAGISLYRRFRNRRTAGKGLPRIIEIGALSSRKPKSPSYSRVHERNLDQLGSSGAQWREHEGGWEGSSSGGEHDYNGLSNGSAVKHKKAWDWDADW